MLTDGHNTIKGCVGGLARGDITLCMSSSCECVKILSRVLRHWLYWKGQVTVSFRPCTEVFAERIRMRAIDGAMRWMRWWRLCVVALTGRMRTCLICAVHHWTCRKDMRCCMIKVQFLSPTLSSCIFSGAVAALHRTGMWLVCLSVSHVSFEQ